MFSFKRIAICLAVATLAAGCQTATEHARDVNTARDAGDRLTVGTVQRKIHIGMTNAQVVEVLGAPNMVTTDEKRRENWVYDKISTQTVYSASSGGINTLFLGGLVTGSAGIGAFGGAGYRSGAGAASTSQRTLTIIIKFDGQNRVRDFAYRSSSF